MIHGWPAAGRGVDVVRGVLLGDHAEQPLRHPPRTARAALPLGDRLLPGPEAGGERLLAVAERRAQPPDAGPVPALGFNGHDASLHDFV